MRRVVDDEVDPGQVLERPDVAAFTADDPPLQVVGRELDDGDRRLGRVAGGDPLQRVRDQRSRAPPRITARLFLHLPDLACELVPDEILRALEDLLARLLRGQTGDLLQRSQRLPMGLAQLLLQRLHVHLAVAETLLLALDLDEASVRLQVLLEHSLLDLRDLDTTILDLGLDLAPQLHRLLAGLDLRLAPHGIRFTSRLAEQPLALDLGAPNPRARPGEEQRGRPQCPDHDSDERRNSREHSILQGGFRCPRQVPRVLSSGSRRARSRPACAKSLRQVVVHPPELPKRRPTPLLIEVRICLMDSESACEQEKYLVKAQSS